MAQPVTKYLYEFDTLGAGHPNDLINDHQAFVNAAAFFQARDGYGTLVLEDGEYIVGRQQLHWFGDTLPGTDWTNYGYPSNDSTQCKALVAIQPGFRLDDRSQFTLQGGANTTVRYRDCLYYGTFLRTPGTDEVFSAAGVDGCRPCTDSLHLPGLLHANVGIMFSFHHCDSITVRDLELNGNIDAALLGGRSAGDGIQTEYDGILLFESSNCVIDNVDAHHFGRDGLLFWGTYADSTSLFTDVYPGLDVGIDPADSSFASWKRTVLFNNQVHNSSFTWNGRQGFSWTALAGLQVTNCDFNYNGAGRMASSPSSGLDIEGAGGPIRVRHGTFDDCLFLHNRASGIISDNAQCMGQQDFKFTRCLVKAGIYGSAIWPEAAQMVFDSCEVYGNVGELYEQPEDLPVRDSTFNLAFRNTNFYEEDHQWSYIKWFFDGHPNTCQYGPQMFRFVKPGRALMSFENCGFYTNCKAIVRFKGRSITDTGLQHCPIETSGPCLSCTNPDDRYVRIKDCVFVNTGREHCPAFAYPAGTEVLSADFATVDGLDIFIPQTVRGGGVNDEYWTPMGTETPDSMYMDTTMTYTTGTFPPCLPFYAHDTVPHWNLCDTTNNVLVQACYSDASCFSDLVIPDSSLASVVGTYFTGTVDVQGRFIVDADVTFSNAQVSMEPGAEIILLPGTNLFNYSSSFFACIGMMWRGITADDGCIVIMTGTRLADSEAGLKAPNSAVIVVDSSEFVNNRVAITVPDQGSFNSVSISVSNSTFHTAGPLSQPYPGQTSTLGQVGFAALDVHDMLLDFTGGNNLIHNMSNGIVARDSYVNVSGCRMLDIQPDTAYGSSAEPGAAIYATGYGGYFTLDQTGEGTAATDSDTFTNCRWSIWTEAMNLTSTANKVTGPSSLTGYHVRYSGGRTVEIFENDLDVQWTGIDLRFNDGATSLNVHDSQILFGTFTMPPPGVLKGSRAINVQEMNGYNPASEIRDNLITFRPGSPIGKVGINMTSASHYAVFDNALGMGNQATDHHGINMEGCTYNRVSCNSVTGLAPWAGNWSLSPSGQSGIRHSMGDNNVLGCNDVTLMRQGLLFNGYSPSTKLLANNMGLHDIGLLLTMGALIGPQEAKGNIWNNACTTLDAEWIGPAPGTVLANRIFFNQILNPLCMPSSFDPPGWFTFTTLPNFECAVGMPECPPDMIQGGGGRDQGMDELVMQGVIQNGIYTDETQLTLAYELYIAMFKDPTLYASGPYTDDFMTLMAGSVADDLNDVEEPRKELYGLPSTVGAQVEQNEQDITALMGQIAAAREQIEAGGLGPPQVAALEADITIWQQAIEDLNTLNRTAIVSIDAAREVEAQLLEGESGFIASTELIEQNARAVNEIYLNTIGRSGEEVEFDPVQAGTLLDIAGQCPLLGGNPVYQARSLYSLIDDAIEFDDALICIADGLVVKNLETAGPSVVVFPNPTLSEQLFFEVSGLDNGDYQGMRVFYDMQGRPVLRKSTMGLRGSVDVHGLSQGVYHWSLSIEGTHLDQGKVAIY